MKRFLMNVLCITCFLWLGLVSNIPRVSAAEGDWKARWQKLEQEAKKEGNLVVYSTTAGDAIREIFTVFQAKYGVKVDYVVGRGRELARRMKSERAASVYVPDVIMSGGTTLLVVMKPAGLIDSFTGIFILPDVLDKTAWVAGEMPYLDNDQYGIGFLAIYQRYLTRNTNLVGESELKSYKDILDPKWKGKLVFNDPTVSGGGNAFVSHLAHDIWGLEKTLDYMRKLVKQEPVITRNTGLQVEWLAKGKYPIGIAPMQERVAHFMEAGASLSQVKVVEGGKLTPGVGGLALANKRPHPNAAAIYVNWLLTSEGQALAVKAYKYPGTRVDAPKTGVPSAFYPSPGEKVFRTTEAYILAGRQMMKHSKNIFGPLIK
ncbi:MAG: extracellular solute-binding protein [Dehalococcoidia bacterium]|nr:extracellular solute-binding protein [Desulfobacterales bacterium]MDZ4246970.1 extracellular solute-binding protein [Dehalococcoidia bacterium]